MPLQHEELTHAIIGAAIDVHKELGPGFVEPIYQRSLSIVLHERGLEYDLELRVPVSFRGRDVGAHEIDLLVEDRIIVELKAVKHLEEIHFAKLRSYLKAMELEHGLLLNFAKPILEIKRVIGPTPRARAV